MSVQMVDTTIGLPVIRSLHRCRPIFRPRFTRYVPWAWPQFYPLNSLL